MHRVGGGEPTERVEGDLVGPLCTSMIAWPSGVMLPRLEAGDLVAVHYSGAYGPTASPLDFDQPFPAPRGSGRPRRHGGRDPAPRRPRAARAAGREVRAPGDRMTAPRRSLRRMAFGRRTVLGGLAAALGASALAVISVSGQRPPSAIVPASELRGVRSVRGDAGRPSRHPLVGRAPASAARRRPDGSGRGRSLRLPASVARNYTGPGALRGAGGRRGVRRRGQPLPHRRRRRAGARRRQPGLGRASCSAILAPGRMTCASRN